MHAEQPKPKLQMYEWLAVYAILSVLVLLTAFSMLGTKDPLIETGEARYTINPMAEVYLQGAVEKPGRHQVKSGSTVGELLEKVKPLPGADLRKVKPDKKLRAGQIVKIPARVMLTVTVKGAVKREGSFRVPKGVSYGEIGSYIDLAEHADMSKLKKNRKIKEGETVQIPSKND